MLRKPSRDELLAQMAEMQRQMDALQQQLGAEVSGSGAVAQDHSVATGAYGTAIGSVQGNVYVGPPARDPEEALAIYRRVYVAGCRQLPMRGIDIGASDPTGGQRRLDLDRVYVALDTTARVDKDTVQRRQAGLLGMTAILSRGASVTEVSSSPELLDQEKSSPLQALAALLLSKRAVILGAPGAGKSTLLSHLGLCLALHGLEPEEKWLERLPGWPPSDAEVLPISVVLRDFARNLPKRRTEATPQHLWQFIERGLRSQNLAFAAAPLHETLESGRAIVLLDGLDEIPTKEQRVFVRDAVTAFARRYPKSSVVVTCRTLSYQDPAWQLELFTAYELAPLDEAKIDHFITAWYAELGRLGVVREDTAGALARQLRTAVRRPDLWRLAPNPLLLTVMALVHAHKGQLPDARALLYEETVDILLWRWEQIKAAGEEGLPPLRQLLLDAGRADVDLKKVLWELAFEAHIQT
ncbi:MAG: NACHT domain-containing protein, partial [Anaerolineae bacterium]|nr:NACHT domain-containing protein [Anaerolineae bacterium]